MVSLRDLAVKRLLVTTTWGGGGGGNTFISYTGMCGVPTQVWSEYGF